MTIEIHAFKESPVHESDLLSTLNPKNYLALEFGARNFIGDMTNIINNFELDFPVYSFMICLVHQLKIRLISLLSLIFENGKGQ